jgi:hypothetical protein
MLLRDLRPGGGFLRDPVRIFMAPRDRATAVTVTNEGDDELVMQADIYTWKQKPDGTDDLRSRRTSSSRRRSSRSPASRARSCGSPR